MKKIRILGEVLQSGDARSAGRNLQWPLTWIALLCFCLCCALLLRAQMQQGSGTGSSTTNPTMIVDAANGPGTDYTTLQAAWDAASDGEVIGVRGDTAYAGFSANDSSKNVAFLAMTEPSEEPPTIKGSVVISGINDGSVVVLDGFVFKPQEGVVAVDMDMVSTQFINCLFNNKNSDGVPLVYASNSDITLIHCTLIGGSSLVSMDYSEMLVQNSIIWNGDFNYGDPAVYACGQSQVEVEDSIIRGGQFGAFDVDPLLTRDGWLMALSPARSAAEAGWAETDIREQLRSDSAPDMGCDEFTDTTGNGFPDWWELRFFGNIGVASGQAHLDAYLYGTDPLNPDSSGDGIPDIDKIKLGITSQNDDEIVYDNNSMIIEVTGKAAPIVRDEEGNVTSFTKAN